MFRDHLVGDEDVAEREHAPRRKQHISPYHHLRRYRICILLALMLFGLHLLAVGPGTSNSHALAPQQVAPAHASIQTAQVSASRAPLSVGMGAGTSFYEHWKELLTQLSFSGLSRPHRRTPLQVNSRAGNAGYSCSSMGGVASQIWLI